MDCDLVLMKMEQFESAKESSKLFIKYDPA